MNYTSHCICISIRKVMCITAISHIHCVVHVHVTYHIAASHLLHLSCTYISCYILHCSKSHTHHHACVAPISHIHFIVHITLRFNHASHVSSPHQWASNIHVYIYWYLFITIHIFHLLTYQSAGNMSHSSSDWYSICCNKSFPSPLPPLITSSMRSCASRSTSSSFSRGILRASDPAHESTSRSNMKYTCHMQSINIKTRIHSQSREDLNLIICGTSKPKCPLNLNTRKCDARPNTYRIYYISHTPHIHYTYHIYHIYITYNLNTRKWDSRPNMKCIN